MANNELYLNSNTASLRRGIRKVNGQVLSPFGGGAGGGNSKIFIINILRNTSLIAVIKHKL